MGAAGEVNTNGSTNIAYCFTEIKGFSKFGSYTGAGTSKPFVYTGFRPAFLMVKNKSATGHWQILDNKRKTANLAAGTYQLRANSNVAESSAGTFEIDLLSNGFKVRTTESSNWNTSGQTFIYMAFAEAPFVNSNGVPCNAR